MDSIGRSLETLAQDILKTPEEFVENINQNICRNGEIVWISWTNKAIIDSEGKVIGNLSIGQDITERKQAEDKVRKAYSEVEKKIEERTIELSLVNADLTAKMADHKRAEKALQESEKDLKGKGIRLEELNSALKILLEKGDRDRKELEEKTELLGDANMALKIMLQKSAENREDIKEEILLLLKNRISPYISKLKKRDLDDKARDFVEVIETNIQDIVSPFSQSLSFAYVNLSPKEIQVANHIKQNRSTKEIAILLNLAKGTVDVHRNNIREKLGIKNKGISLNTYLASMH
jgi:DNA-binding CsgD family transcriptional regulator